MVESNKVHELESKLVESVKKGFISQQEFNKWKRRIFLEEWYEKNIKNEEEWNRKVEIYFKLDEKKLKDTQIVYNEDGKVAEASLDQILELLLVKKDHKISEKDMFIDLQEILFPTSRLYVKDDILLRKIIQIYFKHKIQVVSK